MENNQQTSESQMTQEEMLNAIYENTRKTKNYMKWQLYITVALVVLPLLAALALIPMVLSSLGNVYGSAGLLQ
jgi:predicted anti-sigma-YlaC factor YlaD